MAKFKLKTRQVEPIPFVWMQYLCDLHAWPGDNHKAPRDVAEMMAKGLVRHHDKHMRLTGLGRDVVVQGRGVTDDVIYEWRGA